MSKKIIKNTLKAASHVLHVSPNTERILGQVGLVRAGSSVGGYDVEAHLQDIGVTNTQLHSYINKVLAKDVKQAVTKMLASLQDGAVVDCESAAILDELGYAGHYTTDDNAGVSIGELSEQYAVCKYYGPFIDCVKEYLKKSLTP